ncbi:SpoIIIAC/SpoIIIAD family protein [Sellimonas caecigallum]|uniref:Stage III sporulation protein AD n=1 Tax=Sellimonas caecigallum TaxID=2592333 RepID=A0ABS7L691_9FIRM|nr:SpoIIIAC/SpoIIIAD family protein [Sellimonas caecigallum]MBY0758594.1 stage III sporulation protein AD [Sellimonas caecigallum]OUP03305.1 stage III sporulation protein AD [Drancourtella sp. An210]OUP64820.1 stage III sporulation protein AD [Drancourtella sp. An177]
MTMMQAAAAAVCAALLAMQFKGQKGEYGIYISIAAGMVICFGILSKLSSILDTIREIGSMIRIEGSYLAILLKMLGITYAAEFASNICRDCGNQTLAVQIELFGKLAVLVLSMPILLALLKTVQAFLT